MFGQTVETVIKIEHYWDMKRKKEKERVFEQFFACSLWMKVFLHLVKDTVQWGFYHLQCISNNGTSWQYHMKHLISDKNSEKIADFLGKCSRYTTFLKYLRRLMKKAVK